MRLHHPAPWGTGGDGKGPDTWPQATRQTPGGLSAHTAHQGFGEDGVLRLVPETPGSSSGLFVNRSRPTGLPSSSSWSDSSFKGLCSPHRLACMSPSVPS